MLWYVLVMQADIKKKGFSVSQRRQIWYGLRIATAILVCLVLASRSGGRQRSPLYHNFSTNAAPINGTCFIEPELGYADPIVTQFNVTCPDYIDSDQPIEYLLFFNGSGLFRHLLETN